MRRSGFSIAATTTARIATAAAAVGNACPPIWGSSLRKAGVGVGVGFLSHTRILLCAAKPPPTASPHPNNNSGGGGSDTNPPPQPLSSSSTASAGTSTPTPPLRKRIVTSPSKPLAYRKDLAGTRSAKIAEEHAEEEEELIVSSSSSNTIRLGSGGRGEKGVDGSVINLPPSPHNSSKVRRVIGLIKTRRSGNVEREEVGIPPTHSNVSTNTATTNSKGMATGGATTTHTKKVPKVHNTAPMYRNTTTIAASATRNDDGVFDEAREIYIDDDGKQYPIAEEVMGLYDADQRRLGPLLGGDRFNRKHILKRLNESPGSAVGYERMLKDYNLEWQSFAKDTDEAADAAAMAAAAAAAVPTSSEPTTDGAHGETTVGTATGATPSSSTKASSTTDDPHHHYSAPPLQPEYVNPYSHNKRPTVPAIFKRFGRHLWPTGRWDLKFLLVSSLAAILLSKCSKVFVPVLYKLIIDKLVETQTTGAAGVVVATVTTNATAGSGGAAATVINGAGGATATPWLTFIATTLMPGYTITQAVLVAVAAYGFAMLFYTFWSEAAPIFFSKVGSAAAMNVNLDVFRKLHQLPMVYHADRSTGSIAKAMDRSTRAFGELAKAVVFVFVPTCVELLLASLIIYSQTGIELTILTLVAVLSYAAFSYHMANWRARFPRIYNRLDTRLQQTTIDSLVNYETVKVFCNESYEEERIRALNKQINKSAVYVDASLGLMRFGKQCIFIVTLTLALIISAAKVQAGLMTVGDFVLVEALLLQLFTPLTSLGAVYRQALRSATDMAATTRFFDCINEREPSLSGVTLPCVGIKQQQIVMAAASASVAKSSAALTTSTGPVTFAPFNPNTPTLYATEEGTILTCANPTTRTLAPFMPSNYTIEFRNVSFGYELPFDEGEEEQMRFVLRKKQQQHEDANKSISGCEKQQQEEGAVTTGSEQPNGSDDGETSAGATREINAAYAERTREESREGGYAAAAAAVAKGADTVSDPASVLVPKAYEPSLSSSQSSSAASAGGILSKQNQHPVKRKMVLRNLSLVIPGGSTVAFVGPSGSGKSTIVKLLYQFITPLYGQILIDGQDITAVDLTSYRPHVGVVPQDVLLFDDTILFNIRYGNLEASDEEVVEAAKAAHIHETIMQMPRGYDTLVGDRGTRLSGGERQRVAIARVLLKKSPMLLADETTSALDTETESNIMKVLINSPATNYINPPSSSSSNEGAPNNSTTQISSTATSSSSSAYDGSGIVTTVIVAHRLSAIRNVDIIYVLNEKGTVCEQGSHDELMKRGVSSRYYRMWDDQHRHYNDLIREGSAE